MLAALSQLVRHPHHLVGHRNIFLFSHMRANTSLFGHILGSHPDIEGYYEMHIGYYSWKSLWRQKLLYLENHALKPTSRFFFDKLLHDYCVVAPEILARPGTRCIFMLRRPGKTIPSIVGLYRKNQPEHEFAQVEGAAAYYMARVGELAHLAKTMPHGFYYLDAEDLIERSTETLQALSDWLGLSQPLTPEYRMFSKTGAPQAGDSSDRIKSGTIHKSQSDYSDIPLTPEMQAEAEHIYRETRQLLTSLGTTRTP
ncbi:MAG: hypothetical protein AB1421_06165 [Pseudomonadota bacterium]